MTDSITYEADITQALHEEEGWYLVPINATQYSGVNALGDVTSVIFHICTQKISSNHAGRYKGERVWSYVEERPYTVFRMTLTIMDRPCSMCSFKVPDNLKALWILHNWDAIQALK